MTDSLKVAQHLNGLSLNVFDHEQVTITNDATGEVMVNVVASPDGYNMIYHHPSLSEQQAVSLAILMLIQYYNHNIYQRLTED